MGVREKSLTLEMAEQDARRTSTLWGFGAGLIVFILVQLLHPSTSSLSAADALVGGICALLAITLIVLLSAFRWTPAATAVMTIMLSVLSAMGALTIFA